MKKRSITIAGHATSVSLEQPFWDAIQEIAKARGLPVSRLVEEIDETREGNLSSALRIYVLEWYRSGTE
ncbi:MAG: aryl-sulfate sulfotransferase [Alphaproteobacteria bacterium]|nr:aryl-sulfate sulfotransferase [Alphaproteobacteria bacterium]